MSRALAILAAWIVGEAVMASLSTTADAKPNEGRECVAAHEEGQVARRDAHLREARRRFVACASDACPLDVRKDCSAQLDEIDARLPSVIVDARDHGISVADARVSVDGVVMAERLSGLALPMDPGAHTLRVECTGARVREQTILVNEGDKRTRFTVDCDDGSAPAAKALPAGPPQARSIPVGTWVLAGVAVAALASFGTFGALGQAKESSLATSCAPACTDHEVAPARTQFLIADVSLVAAVIAGAGALVIALWPDSSGPRAPVTRPLSSSDRSAREAHD